MYTIISSLINYEKLSCHFIFTRRKESWNPKTSPMLTNILGFWTNLIFSLNCSSILIWYNCSCKEIRLHFATNFFKQLWYCQSLVLLYLIWIGSTFTFYKMFCITINIITYHKYSLSTPLNIVFGVPHLNSWSNHIYWQLNTFLFLINAQKGDKYRMY